METTAIESSGNLASIRACSGSPLSGITRVTVDRLARIVSANQPNFFCGFSTNRVNNSRGNVVRLGSAIPS